MSATGIPPFIMQLLSQNLIGEFVNILVAASDKYDARFVEPSTQNRAANSGDLVISTKLIFPNREKCSACMKYLDSLKNMA